MQKGTNVWHFLAICVLTGGIFLLSSKSDGQKTEAPEHKHHAASGDFPRDKPGPAGPVGSDTDRGKLVAGFRDLKLPPLPVVTPDIPDLPYKLVDGFKEFHLHAEVVKRELLPDQQMNHFGYNGTFPGPTIQVVEGDKVRIVVHNHLPEETTLHLHGLELLNSMDGVPYLQQHPIQPGKTGVYELTLHQTGTFFYHSHDPMQELMGQVGLFIIHPKVNYAPAVDHDFALVIQEFRINGGVNTPDPNNMDFNWFTLNGRSAPYTTPLLIRLGSRVRIRFLNFSTDTHHPMHLHGHTFWVTGTEGGRIPASAWIPGNTVVVGVAQVREVEFVANNPGDWILHCHMFHHMMNHMTSPVGPGSRKKADGKFLDPRYRFPGYPQMEGMMVHPSKEQIAKLEAMKGTSGLKDMWFMMIEGLHSIVRVLPADRYDALVSGKTLPRGANMYGPDPTGDHKMEHKHKH
jgi:hypothetical protein